MDTNATCVTGAAYLLRANGETGRVAPANGTDFTLDELQGFVGGYIQVISLLPDVFAAIPDGGLVVLNEDGKRLGLPANARATEVIHKCGALLWDIAVGDVLVCDESMIQ